MKKFIISSVLSTLRIKYVEHFQTNSRRMDKFNFGYSPNNIPIATERQYKLKLVKKIEAVIKRMRWKVFYFEQSDTHNNSKNIYYGLTSDKTPPPTKLLELFERDLFKMVEKIKFRKINCEFQNKHNSDIKGIKSSRKMLTPADKTSNFYKITKEKYEHLLHNSISKTYEKANSNITKTINEQGKKIANKNNMFDRIPVNGKEECFITLKDHKPNFENDATSRLINPAKN